MLSAVVLGLLLAQEPEPAPAPPKPAPAVAVKALGDREARDAVTKLGKALGAKQASLAQRLEAVEAASQGSHTLLVKPLVKIIQADAALTVRKAAAEGLARQPAAPARAAIVSLLDDGAIQRTPEVAAVLVKGLLAAGYQPQDWRLLRGLFERDYADKHVLVQRAILDLVTATGEKQAWRLLLDHLDEPIPEDVDGAANPPAEYWEARWKAWRVLRPQVVEALAAITGQRFGTREEALAWSRVHGAKVGLE